MACQWNRETALYPEEDVEWYRRPIRVARNHADKRSNAFTRKIIVSVQVKRKEGSEGPARSFADYAVSVGATPEGVELLEKL